MKQGTLLTVVGLVMWAVLKWAFDHFIWDWLTHVLESRFHLREADLISTVSSFVIPIAVVVVGVFVIFRIAGARAVPTEPQPDMQVSEAIDYIVNDSTATLTDPKSLRPEHPPSFLPAPGARVTVSGVEHQDARKHLNAKLISGELRSWGLRQIQTHLPNQFEHSPREISKDYWDDMQLDFQSCLYYKGPYSQTMTIPGRTQRHHWAAIRVSRDQVERLWPGKSVTRRAWAKIRMKPRIRHAANFTVPEPIPTESILLNQQGELRFEIGSGEPFDRIAVNEYGVHHTIYVAVRNIGSMKVTNCNLYRTYIASLNDKTKTFLDGPFSLDPNEVRYFSTAMFNETKDLPHAKHLIGLPMPPGAFGAGVMQPRLAPNRRHIISLLVETPDAPNAITHCELWVDEQGKLRIAAV